MTCTNGHDRVYWERGISAPWGGPVYDLDAILTCSQAASLLGVSRQLVNKWRTNGHLPNGYRLGDLLQVEAKMRHHPRSHRN